MKALSVKELAKLHKVSTSKIQGQIKKGLEVEKEHTSNNSKRDVIARQHLAEFPDYYDRLDDMEAEAKNESMNFERGLDPKVSIGIGNITRAMKWLNDNQEIISNFQKGDKLNYKFKLDHKTNNIIISGLSDLWGLRELKMPDYVIRSLTPRVKFLVGISDYNNPKLYKYAIETIENGYIPPPSLIDKEFSRILKVIGKDKLLEILIKTYPNRILNSSLTAGAQYVWSNDILSKYFDNNEFKQTARLADRGEKEINRDRQAALDLLERNGFYDITTPRQEKNKSIQVEDGSGSKWVLSIGGRLRRVGAKSNIYGNDNTTFSEMARILI